MADCFDSFNQLLQHIKALYFLVTPLLNVYAEFIQINLNSVIFYSFSNVFMKGKLPFQLPSYICILCYFYLGTDSHGD